MPTIRIVVAPLSNSTIRDWPIGHYERLLGEVLDAADCALVLVGSAEQRPSLEALRRRLARGDERRIVVETGRSMLDVARLIRSASLVISNNSGIAHLAAAVGRPVVTIFSASHEIERWRPRGSDVSVVQAEIACRHCHLDHNCVCPNDHRCMVELPPSSVFAVVMSRLRDVGLQR